MNSTSVFLKLIEYLYDYFQVPFGGRTYGDLETIQVTLNAYETIKLRDIGLNDLTGTRVVASDPVAVFSGNLNTGEI